MPLNAVAKEPRRPRFLFLKQYLRRPFGIGAIAASSDQLARLMVDSIDLQPSDIVVELGPGTGVFTRELLSQGADPRKLILVEINLQFVTFLQTEFPGVQVVAGDARALPAILQSMGVGHADKIISGLPLRGLKDQERRAITEAIAAALKPGGVLVQFSYFNGLPLPKSVAGAVGFAARRAGFAVRNVPPAFVWKYTKQSVGGPTSLG